ncbi:MAG: TrbC family F-type conjugative pilus assembly protein [Aquificota bacterium]|nr:TrbC family F-type conjugative pilus assembly protein [Aquificota bacterium]
MFFKAPPLSGESSKEKVIFYLFSRSVPHATVDNVFRQAKSLKGWKFYGVIRGIDREILSYIASLKNFKYVSVKVNPLIFEKVGAEVVPAFVFAECKMIMGILRTKNCEFNAVLYGDVSLKWALRGIMRLTNLLTNLAFLLTIPAMGGIHPRK